MQRNKLHAMLDAWNARGFELARDMRTCAQALAIWRCGYDVIMNGDPRERQTLRERYPDMVRAGAIGDGRMQIDREF